MANSRQRQHGRRRLFFDKRLRDPRSRCRATSDLQLLVFHDNYLDRLTTGHGKIAENSSEHLAAHVRYRPEFMAPGAVDGRLPELEDVFIQFPGSKFNIEVKNAAAARDSMLASRRWMQNN